MAGRRGGKCYPRHLRGANATGIRECQATGFLRRADSSFTDDVRQGHVATEFADLTPGFGTRHPQDVVSLGALDDPSPIENMRPKDNKNLSKSDLNISDGEILLSITEGRPPRRGY